MEEDKEKTIKKNWLRKGNEEKDEEETMKMTKEN